MCPACIATGVWLAAGAASAAASGLGALALRKLRHQTVSVENDDFQLRMQPDELELRGEEA